VKYITEVKKLTDFKWMNLFSTKSFRKDGSVKEWIFASRKESPIQNKDPDAVVIVPIVETPGGNKLVVIKEYREPIADYEWGFPAGLIDKGMDVESTIKKELKEETGLDLVEIVSISSPVISSAGLSDESVVMAIVKAKGELSQEFLSKSEDIEPFILSVTEVHNILLSTEKIGAKSWGLFYHYSKLGRIE